MTVSLSAAAIALLSGLAALALLFAPAAAGEATIIGERDGLRGRHDDRARGHEPAARGGHCCGGRENSRPGGRPCMGRQSCFRRNARNRW